MNLYVVRHADALSPGGSIKNDFERTLSERGKADAMMMARALAQIDLDIKSVLTSPLVRAVETGKLFGRELKRDPEISKYLIPGGAVRLLVESILALSNGSGVVAIGHQPDVSNLIAHLISPGHIAEIAMDTSSIACVQLSSNGSADLRWLLTPETVRKMNFAL